jgi:acyl transferase domain-containing protein/acyl carrier protein
VAVIGIGCRFPGGIVDPVSFWRLLTAGTNAITEIPADRIDIDRYFDPAPATPGRMMSRFGGFLERIDELDAAFFGISPREAQSVDPQQRVLLEIAWEALEDAGQNVLELEGSRTAVFVGQWVSDFEARLFADPEAVDFAMTTGSGRYASSGRISYVFGLRGPSFTIDSACSSSLAAVHLGVRSIRSGEAELALAGGVNIILQPQISIGYSQSRLIAADGRCKFGDASGDGYVRSEGAGLIVLKALDKAVADGDRIYAVIRGTAVNNDGRSSGILGRPSRIGQEEMLKAAYDDAGVAPARVGYVEAHGTGTPAGDPVELAALGKVLGSERPDGARCLIGSVKTNLGHTEGAAGIAGVIKASLALRHGAIPASLHFAEPNPNVPWAELPFRIPSALSPWPPSAEPRVAGVSSFGISGTNAHCVLEEAPRPSREAANPEPAAALLPLSARSPGALQELARRYAALLDASSTDDFIDVCWSAATRRTPLEYRAAFVASDRAGMVQALRGYGEGVITPAAEGRVRAEGRPRIAFVCPGQGGQWVGMARELAAHEPVFREALDECDAAAQPYADWSIVAQLHAQPGTPDYRLDRIDVVQPVLVALAIAYARLWRARGIEPDAVVGHSMGEVAAAHIAGVLTLDQAMSIICRRSALMRRTSGRGAMALVDLSIDETTRRLAGRGGQLAIAVNNSPRSCVVSGDVEAVQTLLADLEADGVFCRRVNVDVASHSPQMNEPAAELQRQLTGLTSAPAHVPIFSTVLGRRAEGNELGAGYWARNLREPVRFAACVQAMLTENTTVFVELGPHPVLTAAVEQTAQSVGASTRTLACGRRDESDAVAMLNAAAAIWAAGVAIDWKRILPLGGRVADLPTYPWQRERFWAREAQPVDARGRLAHRNVLLSDEQRKWLHALRWIELAAVPAAATASPRAGTVLLVTGRSVTELQAYEQAFAAERTMVQAVSSVDAAAQVLQGPARSNVAAIVVLGSDMAELPYDAVTLLQSLADAKGGRRRPRLLIVTCGAQAVDQHPRPRVAADQATLWGLGRVMAQEHPELVISLLDLDPSADTRTRAAQLAQEVFRGEGETQIALRDGRRFVLRLQALDGEPPAASSVPWPADGAWLVTGGLGEVGLHLASGMVAQGVRRLVLVGRSGLPPRTQWYSIAADSRDGRRIAAVRALEAAGAAVHLLVADVADAADLERVLRAYEEEAWPPIRGVLHAAGLLETDLATRIDRASLRRVLAAKFDGARNLDRLLPSVERFVMVSSNVATLGLPGMASYAAANAGLDAIAQDRRARGLHGLSIQSGAWMDTGMNSGVSADESMRQLNDIGIQGFTPAQGVAVFHAVAGRAEACITVMPIDWTAFTASRRGRNLRLFEDCASIEAPARRGRASISEQLVGADLTERRRLLDPFVRDVVGSIFKLPPARVDPRKPLGAMGLTSLMAMELRNRLESALDRPLSATLAWNYPTVEALVGFLCGEAPGVACHLDAVHVAAAPTPTTVDAVAHLSDLDAARLLRRTR